MASMWWRREWGAMGEEPPPLQPHASDRLCITSGCSLWGGARQVSTGASFGPNKQGLSRPVPLPSPRVRDFSPPPPTECSALPDNQEATFSDGEEEGPGSNAAADADCALHKAVWLADWAKAKSLLAEGADINQPDGHGATPLMLAVELRPRAAVYQGIIAQLLEAEADPRLRSAQGWSPMDEAVSRGEEDLVRLLFESTQKRLKERWDKRLSLMTSSLAMLPDFECRIKWEFESPLLPLVSRIAPSDVVRLRKRGTSLRVDSTLASWKRFRLSKRRDLTTLFQGKSDAAAGPRLSMLNHSKKTVVDVTEGLDTAEKGAVLGDLVSADAVQWDMKLDGLEVAEATNWLGGVAPPCEVNGWRALRFDVKGTFGVSLRKKGRRKQEATFQDYFGCSLPADACAPELREEFREDSSPARLVRESSRTTDLSNETLEYEATFDLFDQRPEAGALQDMETVSELSEVQWPISEGLPDSMGFLDRPATPCSKQHSTGSKRRSTGSSDRAGKTSHRIAATVWLATDFTISLQQFLPILDALSVEHEAMLRLKEVLSSDTLQAAIQRAQQAAATSEGGAPKGHLFPVRAAVPVNLAVRALVHFEAFELRSPESMPQELFEVPADYQRTARVEAQKTPKRAKKRMLLANLAM